MKLKSIKIKILLVAVLVGLLPMVIFGVLTIRSSKADLEKEIKNKLVLLAEAKEGQVFTHLDGLESRTVDFSSDGFIRDSLKEIARTGSLSAVDALNQHLVKNKQPLDKTLVGINILDLDGKIIASTDKNEIGGDESDDEYFPKGKEGVYLTEMKNHEHFGQAHFFAVSAPLTDKETGNLLGEIVNYFDVKKLGEILTGEFQLAKGALSSEGGRTGTPEIYLVNREKKMFVHPVHEKGRHSAEMFSNTLPVQKCLENQEEIIAVYPNYAGEEVLGASMCLVARGWTLMAEVTTKEAFSPIADMQVRLGLMSALFAILAPLVCFMVTNKIIVRPIKKLREATEVIARGNLDYLVDIKTKDEIEQLGDAFNGMAAKLKESCAALKEKARLEFEEKTKLEALLASIGDGVVAIDRNFTIVLFNKKAAELSGWSAGEAVGKPFREIIKLTRESDNKENIAFIEEVMLFGEPRPMENNTLLVRKDGSRIYVADSATPVLDKENKVAGAIIIFRDVSKETGLERARTDLISVVAHQLRNPPTVIKGYLQMLTDEAALQPEGKQKEYLREMNAANESMIDLVNALMNVFRIDFGGFAILPEPSDLTEISDRVLGQFELQIREKKIKLEKVYDKNMPIINIDPKIAALIISNLASNAIKYTPEGGSIKIAIRKEETDMLIQVSDTGRGISKDEQPKIFSKFFRGDNVRLIEGTGLGLYIVKSAVEQSGGKIWFESEENKGATFYVSMPLSGMRKREEDKGLT